MSRHGNMRSTCKRGHDLDGGARGRWRNGKTYCIPCVNARKDRHKEAFAFDILEEKGDEQLCERIRLQAASIKELQERIDQLVLEKDVLLVQLSEARRPIRAPSPGRTYCSGSGPVKRLRTCVTPTVGGLLSKLG